MVKPKIVFLCHFSSGEIRKHLALNRYNLRKLIFGLKGGFPMYDDFAIWVSDYIVEFEKHPEIEFHIVAPHYGMKKDIQEYKKNGIYYHFFRSNFGAFYTVLDKLFRLQERTYYAKNRRKIASFIREIKPDLTILCGAENPYYSLGVLDIKEIPVYVVLQTLLNDPKRIKMGVGNPYRRMSELEIFRHARYFSTSEKKEMDVIRNINSEAVFLPTGFPTHQPLVKLPKEREYDYVFFARRVTKNKGIEDLLQALSLVKKELKDIRLNVIGVVEESYKITLEELIKRGGIEENVRFSGYYLQIEDTYKNVARAKIVVVPGITAGLNSTVREAMLMGLPTVCYESLETKQINKEKQCLLTASMGDIGNLASQMLYAVTNMEKTGVIADNGKDYAERVFSNEAIVNELLDNCSKIINKEF